MDQAVWNAYVIFKKSGGNLVHSEFRMRLVERLIEESGQLNETSNACIAIKAHQNVIRLSGKHFPSFVANSKSKKRQPVRKCVVCAIKTNENGKRVRRESRFECEVCNVGLCAAPCFKIYHTYEII